MDKNKKIGYRYLPIGWISFFISACFFWSSIAGEYQRYSAITSLLETAPFSSGALTISWFSGSIVFLLGTNFFTILAFVAGLDSWKKDQNIKGKILAIVSVILFFLMVARQMLP